MASTKKKIADGMKSISGKKANLRKSIEELRAISSSLSAFLLKWDDIDAHLSSIQSSIDLRLQQLRSLEGAFADVHAADAKLDASADAKADAVASPRPELLDICSRMDGPSLLTFVIDNRNDLDSLRLELLSAIRSAADPACLVLDAVRGFYLADDMAFRDWFPRQICAKRTCILLLENLCAVRPEISREVSAAAKKLALEWKGKVAGSGQKDHSLPVLGFLELVAAYRLTPEFDIDGIFDAIMMISKRKQAVNIVRSLGIEEHIPSLIEKLISNGKQLDAAKFAHSFELTGKYPLVPLLKDYVKESKKVAEEVRKKGDYSAQSRNVATVKEISYVTAVIKAIDEYKLESEYPAAPLQKQVDKFERMKEKRKRDMIAHLSKVKIQSENANKRARAAYGSSLAAAVVFPPASMLSNQPKPYMADLRSGVPHGVSGLSHFDRAGPGLLEPSRVPGPNFSPPKSYLFPSASSLYERSGAFEMSPLPYDRQPAYDRLDTYERSGGFGNYSLSGGPF